MDQTQDASAPDTLHGWKEIAAYLSRSPRAAQRYERALGLPIHRIRTADGQTVYAFRREIDDWRRAVDSRPGAVALNDASTEGSVAPIASGSAQLSREFAADIPDTTKPIDHHVWIGSFGLAAFALGIVATILLVRTGSPEARSPVPSRVVFVGQTLVAQDASGAGVWSMDFRRDVSQPITLFRNGDGSSQATFADLDGDGSIETLVPVQFALANQKSAVSDALYAIGIDGIPRWVVKPPQDLTCSGEHLNGPWRIHALLISPGSGPRTVWVAFDQDTRWPGVVIEIRPDGTQVVRYAQAGWIVSLANWTTPSGIYLVAGGVSNDESRPVVALIDTTAAPERSPAHEDRYRCDQWPTAPPQAFYVLPNSEFTYIAQSYSIASAVAAIGADLKVTVSDHPEIFMVGPDLRPQGALFGDGYVALHRRYEREGSIHHPVEACPQLGQAQEVRWWTAAGGWQTTTLRPKPPSGLPSQGR